MLSSSARHDASMMFVLTPIVVQSRSPSVASSSTRVTAPVAPAPSRMRTLKSVRWTRSSCGIGAVERRCAARCRWR